MKTWLVRGEEKKKKKAESVLVYSRFYFLSVLGVVILRVKEPELARYELNLFSCLC